MSQRALDILKEKLGDKVISTHGFRGDETAVLPRQVLVETCLWLRDDPRLSFDMLKDMTAVDLLPAEPRFEVVYTLYSLQKGHHLRLKVPLTEASAEVPTLCGVYKIANWLEREIWDMYGIRFSGHPELRRILLYEEFEGHPLRKDYPKEKRQPLVRRSEVELATVLERRGKARPLEPLIYKDPESDSTQK